jgi:hypothetical protein
MRPQSGSLLFDLRLAANIRLSINPDDFVAP